MWKRRFEIFSIIDCQRLKTKTYAISRCNLEIAYLFQKGLLLSTGIIDGKTLP